MVEILPEDAPAPRLCHLIKWPDFDGYGFNLHAERSNPGQFIGKIDESSPAEMAGLREGDRIIEVNGVNIANENHRQVVERIKSNPSEAKLLVVDQAADLWYREQDLVVKSSQINVVYIKTPVPRPRADSPPLSGPDQQQASRPAWSPQPEVPGGPNGNANSGTTSNSNHSDSNTNTDKTTSDSTNSEPNSNSKSAQEEEQQQREEQQQGEQDSEAAPLDGGREPATGGRVSPPMSPDSGRGGDEAERSRDSPAPHAGADSLTIQAEINRNSRPQAPSDEQDERPKLAPSESHTTKPLNDKVSSGA